MSEAALLALLLALTVLLAARGATARSIAVAVALLALGAFWGVRSLEFCHQRYSRPSPFWHGDTTDTDPQ